MNSHHSQYRTRLIALAAGACLSLTSCAPPKGATNTQELVAASTRITASNGQWLLLGTQAQGAVALAGDPFEARYHWRIAKDFPTPTTGIAIAKNAAKAISASNERLVIWNSETGQALHHLSAPAVINDLAINAEGTLAALALANNTAVIINLVRGGVVNTLTHQSPVLTIALDGQYLLTGEEANQAHLWRIDGNAPLHSFSHEDAVNFVAFGPSDLLVTAGRYDATYFRDKHSGKTKTVISSKAEAMDAGRRAIDVIFTNNEEVVIGYSDATVEQVNLTQAKRLKLWTLSPATPFTKSGSSLVGLEQINGKIYGITSDSRAHQLLD